MTELVARYQSKPQIRWATEPITPENRESVVHWVRRWGGRARLVPALGTEEALFIDNPMHGELVVRYGDRVMYNEVLGGDFYPNAPETFEKSWAPLAMTTDTTDSMLYTSGGEPVSDDDASA